MKCTKAIVAGAFLVIVIMMFVYSSHPILLPSGAGAFHFEGDEDIARPPPGRRRLYIWSNFGAIAGAAAVTLFLYFFSGSCDRFHRGRAGIILAMYFFGMIAGIILSTTVLLFLLASRDVRDANTGVDERSLELNFVPGIDRDLSVDDDEGQYTY